METDIDVHAQSCIIIREHSISTPSTHEALPLFGQTQIKRDKERGERESEREAGVREVPAGNQSKSG